MSSPASDGPGTPDGEPHTAAEGAIVAGHGDLAAGLVSAVAQITGRVGGLLPLSNRGMGREQLEDTLRDALARTGASVVFTDLPAGSWTMAARRVQRDTPALVVVTGVNLATLLDWTFRDAATPDGAAARAAVEKGRSAMVVAGGVGGD